VLDRTLEFLGLPSIENVRLEARNARKYPPMSPATEERLRDYFAPHEARMRALLAEPAGA
jgi:hypothetical protein